MCVGMWEELLKSFWMIDSWAGLGGSPDFSFSCYLSSYCFSYLFFCVIMFIFVFGSNKRINKKIKKINEITATPFWQLFLSTVVNQAIVTCLK